MKKNEGACSGKAGGEFAMQIAVDLDHCDQQGKPRPSDSIRSA